jgi:CBS domain-containing protein
MEYFQQETIREAMSRPARIVAPEMTMSDLLRLFASSAYAAYPVVRNEKLVGIISRADVIKPFAVRPRANGLHFDEIMGTTVEEIMSPWVITIQLDAALEDVVELMRAHDFESFPVVDDESRVEGIVARDDIVRALARCTWRSALPLPLAPTGYAIA